MSTSNHPLLCATCSNYRHIQYDYVYFKDDYKNKTLKINFPFSRCKNCEAYENILLSKEKEVEIRNFVNESLLPLIEEGDSVEMPLENIYKVDSNLEFDEYEYLEFKYDSIDHCIIPGLYRNDGSFIPVFFDKDILLYYNWHPDYSVRLYSFSSGNIYYKGERMFTHGFGINRNGKIFKWLGDLKEDFSEENGKDMWRHLKRFQASNIESDHDVYSNFYLSQFPYTIKEIFPESDNEKKIFELKNNFNEKFKKEFGIEILKLNMDGLFDEYRPPILDDRKQIFYAYLKLDQYLIENLSEEAIKKILLERGSKSEDFKKDGNNLRSLKLLKLFIHRMLGIQNHYEIISSLFVLHDLRQLEGHLSKEESFEEEYNSCKKRLQLENDTEDLEVFNLLVVKLIRFYQFILNNQLFTKSN